MQRLRNIRLKHWAFCTGFLACLSCAKYETPPPVAEDIPEQADTSVQRRVLWINIDGAVGAVVEQNMPVNLNAMLPHSKYTFEGLSDNRIARSTDAEDYVNWTTMLTGVIAEKHKVKDDSYIPELDINPDIPEQEVAYFPNIITHITNADPNAKTLCITPWKDLNENMLNNTYETIMSASDEEAQELVVGYLEKEDMDFTLVSFNGMLEAGEAGGFSASNPNYIAALTKIDGYIGECLETINNRENAYYEDWLIVITSNHGGSSDGTWGGATKAERNSFCLFYYDHYTTQEMQGKTLYAAYFDRDNEARFEDPLELYSAGEGRNLSVEFMLRMEPRSDGGYSGNNWDKIMGKRSWGIYRQRSGVDFYMRAGENGISTIEADVEAFNNSLWHSYQLGIASPTRTTKSYLILYDGDVRYREASPTAGYIEDDDDFVIGGTGVPTPYYVAE